MCCSRKYPYPPAQGVVFDPLSPSLGITFKFYTILYKFRCFRPPTLSELSLTGVSIFWTSTICRCIPFCLFCTVLLFDTFDITSSSVHMLSNSIFKVAKKLLICRKINWNAGSHSKPLKGICTVRGRLMVGMKETNG